MFTSFSVLYAANIVLCVWFQWTQTFNLYGRENGNIHKFLCGHSVCMTEQMSMFTGFSVLYAANTVLCVWFQGTQAFSLYGRSNVSVHRFFCTVCRQYCSGLYASRDTNIQFVGCGRANGNVHSYSDQSTFMARNAVSKCPQQ